MRKINKKEGEKEIKKTEACEQEDNLSYLVKRQE